MPIREFICQACGNKSETLVLAGEKEDELPCPKCGQAALKRVMSVCCARVGDGAGGTKSIGSGCSSCSGGSCSTCH